MRRFVIVLILLLGIGVAMPALAQGTSSSTRAANPPFVINAQTHDALAAPYNFFPNIRIVAQNADLLTTEGSEIAHTCTGTAGTNSFWMVTYLPAGKLTIDTADSSFVTGTGTTSDTVVSLYRLTGDYQTVDFTTLAPVACATDGANGSAAGRIKNAVTDDGVYLVQISLQAAETALTGSQISVKATFKPELKLDVDKPGGARGLTFPRTYSFALAKHAIVDLDEPIDVSLDPSIPLNRSVWFKFTITKSMLVTLYAQGYANIVPASVFKVESDGSLTSVPYLTGPIFSFLTPTGVLPKGEYRVRLAFPTQQLSVQNLALLSAFNYSIVLATANLTPVNFDFAENDEGLPGVVGTVDGWTVQNAGGGDGVVCTGDEVGSDNDYRCGYQMTSSGPDEATTLVGTAKLSTVRLKRGEMIQMGFQGSYTGDGHVRMTVELTDAKGRTEAFSREFYPGLFGSIIGSAFVPFHAPIYPTKVKVTIRNLSTVPGDTVWIDDVYVLPVRIGTPLPRELGVLPAPLPPR